MGEGKMIIKEQSKEVTEAWDTLLQNGLSILCPVEFIGYTSSSMPNIREITLYPMFI